jgi:hypothetical protein
MQVGWFWKVRAMLGSPVSFPALHTLLADKTVTIDTVLLEPTVLAAFHQNDLDLVQYLILYVSEFLNAAPGSAPSDMHATAREMWPHIIGLFVHRVALFPIVMTTLCSFLA